MGSELDEYPCENEQAERRKNEEVIEAIQDLVNDVPKSFRHFHSLNG
jgi:ferritin-like protein